MYKKAWCMWKVVLLLIKPIAFFLRSRYRPRRWILKSLFSSSAIISRGQLLEIHKVIKRKQLHKASVKLDYKTVRIFLRI